jgi:hypothetical protein
LASPSSSSTSMVLTSKLIVVVSADIVDLVCFRFFAFATWVAPWEAGIFPAVCRVRRDVATLDVAVRDVAGAVVTPHRRVGDVLIDGVSRHCLHVRHVANLVAALVLITSGAGHQ